MVDLYDVARRLEAFGTAVAGARAGRPARARGDADAVRFWATAADNRGMQVRLFDTREAADAC